MQIFSMNNLHKIFFNSLDKVFFVFFFLKSVQQTSAFFEGPVH